MGTLVNKLHLNDVKAKSRIRRVSDLVKQHHGGLFIRADRALTGVPR